MENTRVVNLNKCVRRKCGEVFLERAKRGELVSPCQTCFTIWKSKHKSNLLLQICALLSLTVARVNLLIL